MSSSYSGAFLASALAAARSLPALAWCLEGRRLRDADMVLDDKTPIKTRRFHRKS
jgi:hypothetical protein